MSICDENILFTKYYYFSIAIFPAFSFYFILLSFAPSAAAVWHSNRVWIPCESNSVWHNIFSHAGITIVSNKKEQDHAIKIHPRIIKKLPQMASRGTLQTPSEPLGDPFGHTPYFKTLLDVIFRYFGSTLASLGAPFWKPFGLLFLSWGLQETKIDLFRGVRLRSDFFNAFWWYFGGSWQLWNIAKV